MPTKTIPLSAPPSQRNVNAFASITKDGRSISAFLTEVKDTVIGSRSVYFEKRPGFESLGTVASSQNGKFIFFDEVNGIYVTSFLSGTTETIFTFTDAVKNCGSLSSGLSVSKITKIAPSETYYLITVGGTRGFYLPYTALDFATTFTADTTSGSPTLTNVSSFDGIYVGQTLSGTGIPATARVKSFVLGVSVTMGSDSATNVNATANGSGITVTRSHLAIIMSTSAPSTLGMVELDGYVFSCSTGVIYNSNLNDLNTWNAANFISPNIETDNIVTIARYRGYIVCLGSSSIEFFYNAGNPSGSVLSRITDLYKEIGGYAISQTAKYLCFVGKEVGAITGSNYSVYMLDGTEPVKISTPTIDKIISSSTFPTLDIFSAYGKTFLQIAGGSTSTYSYSFLYCFETKEFVESGFPFYMRFANVLGVISAIAVNSTSGKIYKMLASAPLYQDDGSAYTMTIQTEPKVLNDGKPFVIKRTWLLADNQASGTTNFDMSADDYTNWVDIGDFDMTATQKVVYGGVYCESSCAFKLEHSANTAWRGQALMVDWEPCKV